MLIIVECKPLGLAHTGSFCNKNSIQCANYKFTVAHTSCMDVETTPDLVSKTYSIMAERIKEYRKITARPLTLAEKIMAGHFTEKPKSIPKNGFDYIFLRPDRVALQDVTGQMVMLQFMPEMKRLHFPQVSISVVNQIRNRILMQMILKIKTPRCSHQVRSLYLIHLLLLRVSDGRSAP